MDWQERQRIWRDELAPRVDDWICDTRPVPRTPIPELLGMSFGDFAGHEILYNLICPEHRATIPTTGVTGPLIGNDSWAVPNPVRQTIGALCNMLAASKGAYDHSHQMAFLLGPTELGSKLIAALLTYGPYDSLDGRGPGKALEAHRDERGRLHNEDGPALRFHGKAPLFALHGVRVSGAEWHVRDDAKEILGVTNVEVRRALMQRMGLRKFIEGVGLRPSHKDRYGTLYRLEGDPKRSWDPANGDAFVHVQCPSTKQDYVLPVPPTVETAHEAVAWTFGMVPEDYDPQKET